MSPVQLTLIRCKVLLGYRRNTKILSTLPWVAPSSSLSQEMSPSRVIRCIRDADFMTTGFIVAPERDDDKCKVHVRAYAESYDS